MEITLELRSLDVKISFQNVFSNELFEVDLLVDKNTVKLTDGRIINIRDCIHVKSPITNDIEKLQLTDLSKRQMKRKPVLQPVLVLCHSAWLRKPIVSLVLKWKGKKCSVLQ